MDRHRVIPELDELEAIHRGMLFPGAEPLMLKRAAWPLRSKMFTTWLPFHTLSS